MCDSEFLMFVYFLVVYCLGGKFCGEMTKPLFLKAGCWRENCVETNELGKSLWEIIFENLLWESLFRFV